MARPPSLDPGPAAPNPCTPPTRSHPVEAAADDRRRPRSVQRGRQGLPAHDQGSVTTVLAGDWQAVVAARGAFDLANADLVLTAVSDHLDAGRTLVRLDLSGVDFLDCSLVRVMLQLHQRCRHEHRALIVSAASPQVRRVLQLTGLDHTLLVDTADRAG